MENVTYKELYNNALVDPSAIDSDTLSTLIDRYPYAQSLHIAKARKHYQEQEAHDVESAFFYVTHPQWLYGFVVANEHPSDEVSIPTADTTTAAPLEADTVTQHAHDGNIETVIPEIDDSGLAEHPVSMDYVAYEEKSGEVAETDPTGMSQEVVPISQATPHEKVSVYNDDHLPYSFLWWLNKTRMEHAHTYQPYAPLDDSAVYPADPSHTPDEERLLDQQIRENIFHLQSPEEKLGSDQPAETISFQIPKKTDPIIERFIREEPQIKPPQADKINLENKARKSAEDQLTLVTETLANIYVEQGLYPKAIAIYQKLSLKYPEKSTYFAARITELTNKLP